MESTVEATKYLYFVPAGKCAPRSLRTECNLNLPPGLHTDFRPAQTAESEDRIEDLKCTNQKRNTRTTAVVLRTGRRANGSRRQLVVWPVQLFLEIDCLKVTLSD